MPSARIHAIMFHEAEADRLQARSDEHRWHAAELIATAELAEGTTKARLRQIGKSEAHVRYMARAWETKLKFRVLPSFPPFNEIYNSPEVRGIAAPMIINFRMMPRLRWRRDGNRTRTALISLTTCCGISFTRTRRAAKGYSATYRKSGWSGPALCRSALPAMSPRPTLPG